MNYGQTIRELRKLLELKQGDFAERIGTTQSYLSQIENERKQPSLDLLERISKEVNVPLVIMLWYGVTKEDVHESKRKEFELLKPTMDKLIETFFKN